MQKSILIVDDEEAILHSMLRIFTKEGYHCLTARQGNEALQIIANNRIDMVISDAMMPGMSGDMLLSRIRENYPCIIGVIISGNMKSNCSGFRFNPASAQLYLTKPWNTSLLIHYIFSLFNLYETLQDKSIQPYTGQWEGLTATSPLGKDLAGLKPEQSPEPIFALHPEETTAILQLVNSAFTPCSFPTLTTALNSLGDEIFSSILLLHTLIRSTAAAFTTFYVIDTLRIHSCFCNAILLRLHELVFKTRLPREFGATGLLHDIGKWLIASLPGSKQPEWGEPASVQGLEGLKRERTLLGYDHTQLGAWWLNRHNISPWLCELCLHHHGPLEPAVCHAEILALLHLADIFAWQKMTGRAPDQPDNSFMELLKLSNQDLADLYLRSTDIFTRVNAVNCHANRAKKIMKNRPKTDST